MKKFQEFIGESELDDLRRDLMSLGFSGYKVTLKSEDSWENFGPYTDDQIWYDITAVGSAETEKKAAGLAISALLKIWSGNTKAEQEIRVDSVSNKTLTELSMDDLIQKALKGNLLPHEIMENLDSYDPFKVKVEEYNGGKVEGVVIFDLERGKDLYKIHHIKKEDSLLENELENLRRDLMGMGFQKISATIDAYGSSRIYEFIENYNKYYEGSSTGYGDTKEEALRHAILALFMGIEDHDRHITMTTKNIVNADIDKEELFSSLKDGKIDLSAVTTDYDLYGICPVSFGEGGDLDLLGKSYFTLTDIQRF